MSSRLKSAKWKKVSCATSCSRSGRPRARRAACASWRSCFSPRHLADESSLACLCCTVCLFHLALRWPSTRRLLATGGRHVRQREFWVEVFSLSSECRTARRRTTNTQQNPCVCTQAQRQGKARSSKVVWDDARSRKERARPEWMALMDAPVWLFLREECENAGLAETPGILSSSGRGLACRLGTV